MRLGARGEVLGSAVNACRQHFAWAFVFSALVNVLFLVPMLYMLQVYERVVPTRGETTLWLLTAVLVVGLATMSLLDAVRSRLLVRAGVRLDRQLARQVLDASLNQRGRTSHGTARRGVREFDHVRQVLTGPAILAVLDAPWIPVYILVAFVLHPWIGVLSFIGTLLVVGLAVRNEQVTRERLERSGQVAAQAYADLDTTLASSDLVRALGLRRALVSGHLAQRRSMLELQTQASLAGSGLAAGSKFLRQLLQSLALGLGALLAIDGKVSPGAIFAAMFIVGRALAPVDLLVGNWRTIVQARSSWQTLSDLLEQQAPGVALTNLPRPSGQVEVENLHYLTESGQPILHSISFAVEPGQVVAILGPSGAGKSTLVRILAGAISPSHGAVRIGGDDQRNWDQENLAEHVGFMPQEAALFAGTVKENIARFRNRLGEDPSIVDEDAITAAKAARAHELIQRLNGGYDHPLGLGGRGLSAGQGQRVALARALFRKPAVIVLDEPNANLDAEGDEELARCLAQEKARGATILVVAHRISMLPLVDRILVLKEGRLVLTGPRDQVLAKISQPKPAPAAPQVEGAAR